MPRGQNLRLTTAAAAELSRQAAVAGTPGLMHLDLLPGGCERWAIRLRPGQFAGLPLARADGVTLHAPAEQVPLLSGTCSGGACRVTPSALARGMPAR